MQRKHRYKRAARKGAKAAPREHVLEVPAEASPVVFDPNEGITQALVAAFAELLRLGLRKTVVCARLKIPLETYRLWAREGSTALRLYASDRSDALGVHGEFVLAIDAAEADAHARCVEIVMGSEDPDLIFKFMIKRWPKHYLHNGRKVIDDDDGTEEEADAETESLIIDRLKAMFKDDS